MRKIKKLNASPGGDELERAKVFLNSIVDNIPNMIFVKDAKELRFIRFNRAGERLLGYSSRHLIGKNDYDFFPKKEADFFTSLDRQVLKKGRLLDIPEEPIHTRHHGTRILHTKKIPILDQKGNPLYLLGISEDVTEKKKGEDASRLYSEVIKNMQVAFIIWQLTKNDDPGSLKLIAANPMASKMTGSDMQKMIGKTMQQLFPKFMQTDVPNKYVQVIKTGRTMELGEYHYGDKNVSSSDWAIRAFPLKNKRVGVMFESVTERNIVEREVLNGIAREHHRIGQDLHDGLGQDLTAIAFMSKRIQRALEKSNPDISNRMKEIGRMVNSSIDKTRRLARGLHPIELDSNGLGAALNEFAVTTQDIYKVNCKFESDMDIKLNDLNLANHLLRLAQEAVINAVKHSKAKAVKISLKKDHGRLRLMVKDNGIGFTGKKFKSGHGMGLQIMSYRAKIIGGTLTIKNQQKGGTLVQCLVKNP